MKGQRFWLGLVMGMVVTASAFAVLISQSPYAATWARQDPILRFIVNVKSILIPPTPDPLHITATAIIAQATMRQEANLTATYHTFLGTPPPSHTPDPFTPDALDLTTTAIIQWVTMTQSARSTTTEEAVNAATETEVIQGATMTQAANRIATYQTLIGTLIPLPSATPAPASDRP